MTILPTFGFTAARAPTGLQVLAICLSTRTALALGATEEARPRPCSVLAETAWRPG